MGVSRDSFDGFSSLCSPGLVQSEQTLMLLFTSQAITLFLLVPVSSTMAGYYYSNKKENIHFKVLVLPVFLSLWQMPAVEAVQA